MEGIQKRESCFFTCVSSVVLFALDIYCRCQVCTLVGLERLLPLENVAWLNNFLLTRGYCFNPAFHLEWGE